MKSIGHVTPIFFYIGLQFKDNIMLKNKKKLDKIKLDKIERHFIIILL